jgi:hypothetical protein
LSTDPIKSNSIRNLFSYADNNPIIFLDSDGNSPLPAVEVVQAVEKGITVLSKSQAIADARWAPQLFRVLNAEAAASAGTLSAGGGMAVLGGGTVLSSMAATVLVLVKLGAASKVKQGFALRSISSEEANELSAKAKSAVAESSKYLSEGMRKALEREKSYKTDVDKRTRETRVRIAQSELDAGNISQDQFDQIKRTGSGILIRDGRGAASTSSSQSAPSRQTKTSEKTARAFETTSNLSAKELNARKVYFRVLTETRDFKKAGTAFHEAMGANPHGYDLSEHGGATMVEIKTTIGGASEELMRKASEQNFEYSVKYQQEHEGLVKLRQTRIYETLKGTKVTTY